MSKNQVSTEDLIQALNSLYSLFIAFREQEPKVEYIEDLNYLDKNLQSLTSHVQIARHNLSVLKSVSYRLQKVLIVSSKDGPAMGWESSINNTFRANSEVGQKCAKAAIERYKGVAYLYDPETDSYVNVTTVLSEAKSPVDFDALYHIENGAIMSSNLP